MKLGDDINGWSYRIACSVSIYFMFLLIFITYDLIQ